MISDLKLQHDFLVGLIDLSTYDLPESKRLLQQKGITQLEFSRPQNYLAYRAIAKCISSNIPATSDNFVREIRTLDNECNSLAIAKNIYSIAGWGSAADGYADKLLELSERRQTLRVLEQAQKKILQGSEPASSVKFRLSNNLVRTRGRQLSKGLNEYVNQVEQHVKNVREGKVKPVIPTYIKQLDLALGGWQPTLILIGAQPGVGKSALIASGVSLQALNGHKPFVASLEDEPSWMAYRLVSHETKLNQFDLRFAKLGTQKFEQLCKNNKDLQKIHQRIRVVDGSITGMRIQDLISSINDAIVNQECDSVWIDHLGEINLTNSERTDLEIARHLSLLRGVANKHGVPVVVAAHFKRPADPSLPPSFRDFANSSGAERKARVALGLRRNPGSDVLSVHVMKQTNGPAGQVIDLQFGGAAAMIVETQGGFK